MINFPLAVATALSRRATMKQRPDRAGRLQILVVLTALLHCCVMPAFAAPNAYTVRVISGGQTGVFTTVEFDSGTLSTSSAADGTPKVILHGLGGPGGTVLKVITAADSQTNNVNTLIFNTGTQNASGSASTLFGLGSGGSGGLTTNNVVGLIQSSTNVWVTNVFGNATGFVLGSGNTNPLSINTHIPFSAIFDGPPIFNTPVTFNSTVTNNEYIDNITTIASGTNFVYYDSIVTQQLTIYQNVYVSTNILYGFGRWIGYNAGFVWTNPGDYALIPGLAAISNTGTNTASGTWDFSGANLVGVAAVGGADTNAVNALINSNLIVNVALLTNNNTFVTGKTQSLDVVVLRNAMIGSNGTIVAMSSISVTGSINAGSASITGQVTAAQFSGGGAGLTGIPLAALPAGLAIGITNGLANGAAGYGTFSFASGTYTWNPNGGILTNGWSTALWLNGTVTISNNASITSTLYVHQLQADSITANGTSTFNSLNTVTGNATLTVGAPTQSGSIETSGSALILHQAAPTFSGYEVLVRPSDVFGWTIGSGSTSSNNIVPVYWSTTGGGGDTLALGFTSSDTGTLNTRYAYAVLPVPSLAQGWATGTGMVIRVISSSPSSLTNTLNVRITSPAGSQFTTSNLVSPTSGVVSDYFILASSLPTFANATTNDWTVRFDFQARNSATQGVVGVKGVFR